MFGLLKSSKHPYLKFTAIIFVLLIIINGVYYFASAYSPGCVMCHYMKPYYEQSSHSVHKDISCVTCHPSRRILTAPYLLRYIAGSYNSRPRAEVDDKVCLDCHEAQNLKKQTAFEMNISFNHSDHLGDLKRGKKLRCTSCHARGEYEQHFAINKNVCFTCHFKGADRGHSATKCNVCHGIPKEIVQHGGFKFNHESYLKIGVDCSQCHLDVTKGNAEVEKKKCYQCHIERTEEFTNIDKIHNVHINEKGIDCEECHNSIEHGKVKMISTLEANCENCHQLRHSPQREMYIGSEGRGVGSIASRMFAAQVSCEGCHVDLNGDGKSDLSEKRQSCVKCHSPGYDIMLDKWIAGVDDAVNSISPSVEYARKLINSVSLQGKNIDAEKTFFSDAEANFNLVKDGKGVHNIDYAMKLLENISSNIEGIAGRLGNKNYKVSRGKLLTDDREYCNMCHFAIQPKVVETFGGNKFPHQKHMAFLTCSKCHSKAEHKKITVTKEDCDNCHKNFSKIPETIKYKSIAFSHSLHAEKKNIECTKCHASMDFSKIQLKDKVCSSCHHTKDLSKNCSKCHSVQNNTYNGLVIGAKLDPDIMNSGGAKCEDCHMPDKKIVSRPSANVCVGCHDASYKEMQVDWVKEIQDKSKTLISLIKSKGKADLTSEEETKLKSAKNLVSLIKADGSGGIHNYMVFSSQLDKSIKELKEMAAGKK
ncbi:MAG TPA: cytochrome c3 family protein [Ignavibacteria bacterium]|jgi:hypothetical protein